MVMERVLNLIWLVISLSSLTFVVGWSLRRRGGGASLRRERTAIITVLCLVALLFPIISVTDDFCQDVLLADASAKRRASHVANVAVVLPIVPVLPVEMRCWGKVVVDCCVFVASSVSCCLPVRAPPVGAL
jgi:hypothetical protein